jgi:glyoxylase-like metal-dependent hydrolase (beta-lactamase superfamily II)
MMRMERSAELTRVWLSSWRSRLAGYGVNVYLWRGVLIDSGFPGVRREVRRMLGELQPRGVIISHGHEDHAGNVQAVTERGVPLWRSTLTPAVMRDSESMAAYRSITWGRLRPQAEEAVTPFDPAPLEPVHTPGHSADHHIVWDPERGVMFSADLFLAVKVRVARPDEDPRALLASLRQAAALHPREMWDAHRGRVDDPVRALAAKADWLEALIARVEDRVRAGEPDDAIASAELGRAGAVEVASFGDLSRVNLVRAIRRTATCAA